MSYSKVLPLVRAAVMAALICVATMVIQIPLGIGGYVNLGDGILLVSAGLFSPGYAVAAACIGSALADLLSGYMLYAPATLLIKGGMAWIVSSVLAKRVQTRRAKTAGTATGLLAYMAAELLMIAGYFFYDAIVLSYGMGAWASVPGNLIQGSVGVGVALLLASVRHAFGRTR